MLRFNLRQPITRIAFEPEEPSFADQFGRALVHLKLECELPEERWDEAEDLRRALIARGRRKSRRAPSPVELAEAGVTTISPCNRRSAIAG